MNEQLLQVLAFLTVTVVSSCLIHACLKCYLLAALFSAITATTLLVIFSYLELGYLDPLLIVGFTFTVLPVLAYTFIISLIVGLPFLYVRRRKRAKTDETG